ncbi:MAG: SURF1 family protein [Alphaproteobacteria bacterium]|nr:SURF1 family protein [Alphaproteobacteria bacterium]
MKARYWSLIKLTCLVLLCFTLLLYLGMWQLRRLSWKEELSADLDVKWNKAPLALSEVDKLHREGFNIDYFPVKFEAVLSGSPYLRFYWVHEGKPGWRFIVPVHLSDGRILMLDRGFSEMYESSGRFVTGTLFESPVGEVAVVGRVLRSHSPGFFTPANDPGSNMWYWPDILAMSLMYGLDRRRVVPYLVSQEEGDAVAGLVWSEFFPHLSNRHLVYALQWFGLAAVLIVIYVIFVFRTLHEFSVGKASEEKTERRERNCGN